MTHRTTRDRDRLSAFFRQAEASHAYAIADLDDFFWPTTTAWAIPDAAKTDELAAAVLMVEKLSPPIVYALCPGAQAATGQLLGELLPTLPRRFFFNLDISHLELIQTRYETAQETVCEFQKMVLDVPLPPVDDNERRCELLRDPAELRAFYEGDAYAKNEKDERFLEDYMFEMEPYVGVRQDGKLVAVGGVHLVSETYDVAALGNIATRPDARGQGHSRAIVRSLCRSLQSRVSCITLNVAVDNAAAIACYAGAGFKAGYRYLEGRAEARA